jgi:hypothetical protein
MNGTPFDMDQTAHAISKMVPMMSNALKHTTPKRLMRALNSRAGDLNQRLARTVDAFMRDWAEQDTTILTVRRDGEPPYARHRGSMEGCRPMVGDPRMDAIVDIDLPDVTLVAPKLGLTIAENIVHLAEHQPHFVLFDDFVWDSLYESPTKIQESWRTHRRLIFGHTFRVEGKDLAPIILFQRKIGSSGMEWGIVPTTDRTRIGDRFVGVSMPE